MPRSVIRIFITRDTEEVTDCTRREAGLIVIWLRETWGENINTVININIKLYIVKKKIS